eukprot:NODE_46_length_32145_cov_0.918711.p5 type:complete len:604 gc:universal NODE_46_length_32145_cov_0.918711:29055-27244(-)
MKLHRGFLLISLLILAYVLFPKVKVHSKEAPKYLMYLTHSGFNNQRIALENAIISAYILNRTLVIPPLFIGRAVPYKSFQQLQALIKQRIQQIQNTRRKCVKEVHRRIGLNNASEIRDALYIACRQPTREVMKWSQAVDLNFLAKLNISWIELDPFDYPNLPIEDVQYIKDEQMYSYKLFDSAFKNIHSEQFDYFPVTHNENNILRQEIPVVPTLNTPQSILNQYLGKYRIPLEFDFLSKMNSSVLHFGSLFGSGRLSLIESANIEIQNQIRQNLQIAAPLLMNLTKKMESQLGPFISIHFRSTEATFFENRYNLLKKLNKELRMYTNLWLYQKDSNMPGLLYSEDIDMQNVYEHYQKMTYDLGLTAPKQAKASVAFSDVKSISNMTERMKICKDNQLAWLLELADAKLKSERIVTLKNELPTELPLVLYMATDVSHPRLSKLLNSFLKRYPCTFFLNDFTSNNIIETDPQMIDSIKAKLPIQTTSSLRSEETKHLLSWGKGHLLYFMLDQLMGGHGVAFFGTDTSTFSQAIVYQYLKDCRNEYNYPFDHFKTYSSNQLWMKYRKRVAHKLDDKMYEWLKYIPEQYKVGIMWKVMGCGYLKLI